MELLKKSDFQAELSILAITHDAEDEGFERIRCPLCDWRPAAASTWSCYGEGTPEPPFDWCGTIWNTFTTHGLCPGCRHQWTWTSCLRCHGFSRHDDWYVCED
jgi:hypothetical protein